MLENEIVTMGAKRFLRRPGFGSVCDGTQPEADLQGCNCRFLHNWMAGLAQLPGSDKARKQLCQIHIVVVATHDMGPFHGLNGRYKNCWACYQGFPCAQAPLSFKYKSSYWLGFASVSFWLVHSLCAFCFYKPISAWF